MPLETLSAVVFDMLLSCVLTNEKKGGLTVLLFDKIDKLFMLTFPNKSVQSSSSCKRPETAQRTLFSIIWKQ